jgi:hypothetical protein
VDAPVAALKPLFAGSVTVKPVDAPAASGAAEASEAVAKASDVEGGASVTAIVT